MPISLGYSRKGWTDGEISVEYAKHFDAQTHALAKGHTCALYVDGHNSHLTHGFLDFCRKNKIKVPCYAAHGTHVYQGLDVIVFSPLKHAYGKEHDRHLRETREPITKLNFLKVYGEAHLKMIMPDLIKTAFRKTGIYPFNREVITPEMMAPSRDTSYKIFVPIVPPTPV